VSGTRLALRICGLAALVGFYFVITRGEAVGPVGNRLVTAFALVMDLRIFIFDAMQRAVHLPGRSLRPPDRTCLVNRYPPISGGV
jgi:hypothetical protein